MDSMHDASEDKAHPVARKQIIRGAIAVLIAAAIIAGIGTCYHYNAHKSRPVVRNIADVSDFNIVFIDGKATLYWVDSIDDFLDHIEISWNPDGGNPVSVAKGVQKYVIPDLEEGVTYNFTVTAVGKWGNRSNNLTGGTGKAYKQPRYQIPPPDGTTNIPGDKDGIIGIKGTPVAGQATLSWTNLADSEYDHIEISYEPNHEAVIRIPKGVESKTLVGLTNGVEHTFYAAAVDAQGNRKPLKDLGIFISDFATSPESVFGRPSGGELTLVWDDPSLPPALFPDVDHLEIAYSPDGETMLSVSKDAKRRTITGLSDNTQYEVTVYAVDSSGRRRPVTGVHLLPGLSSFTDDELDAIVRGKPVRGQINLDWTDPELAGLDHIEIITNPGGDDSKMMTVARGVQTHSFTGLNDDETYSFLAYGIDKNGNRQVIKGLKLSTPPASLSEEEIYKMVRGKPVLGQITLDWTEPAFARLDHVDVVINPDGDAKTITLAKNTQMHTFTGLSDSDIYSFLVYGVDPKGNKTVENVTLSTPELPIIRAKPVLGEASLVWKDPNDPNLDHIEFSYSPGGNVSGIVEKGRGNQAFTDLNDDTEYEFHVTAVTTEGIRYAVAAEVVVPTLPVAIGKPVNGQITLDWTDPKDIRPDHIEILYSGPDGNKNTMLATRGMETRDFTGLTDGVEYSFTVLAVDAAGKKYPLTTARVRSAGLAADSGIPPMVLSGDLKPLEWHQIANTTFNNNTIVYALSFGFTASKIPRWVAGGSNGDIAYSNDYGMTWVPANDSHFGSHSVQTIGYANGRWIAGGQSGSMAWSNDAINWTEITNTYFANNDLGVDAIVFYNNRWMAAGGGGSILVSQDNGLTWSPTTTTIPREFDVCTIAFHEGRWIAGATSGAIIYSDDNGATWTAVKNSPFASSAVNVIVYDQNRWMAAGYAQRLAWSDDGMTWKPLARPFYVLCLGYNGYRWVAGGQEGRMAWSGDSGVSWTTDSLGRGYFGDSWVQTVAFGRSPDNHGRWLSGGQNGKIIYADEK